MLKIKCFPAWKSPSPFFNFFLGICFIFFHSLLFITLHITPKMQQEGIQKSCCIQRTNKPFWRAFQPTIFDCLSQDSAFLKAPSEAWKIVCTKNPQNTTSGSEVHLNRAIHNSFYSGECSVPNLSLIFTDTLEVPKKGEVRTTPLTEQIILVMHDMTWLKRPLPKSFRMLHQKFIYYLHIRSWFQYLILSTVKYKQLFHQAQEII